MTCSKRESNLTALGTVGVAGSLSLDRPPGDTDKEPLNADLEPLSEGSTSWPGLFRTESTGERGVD